MPKRANKAGFVRCDCNVFGILCNCHEVILISNYFQIYSHFNPNLDTYSHFLQSRLNRIDKHNEIFVPFTCTMPFEKIISKVCHIVTPTDVLHNWTNTMHGESHLTVQTS